MGELKTDQPLIYHGIQVGTVISLKENVYEGVAVTIQMDRNIPIHEGYQFYSEDKDFFGTSRRIALLNGPKDAPVVAVDKKLYGSYYIGVPEIVTSIALLELALDELRDAFDAYFSGDTDALRFFAAARLLKENSEKIYQRLNNFQNFVDNDIQNAVEKMSEVTVKSTKLNRNFKKKFPQICIKSDSTITALSQTINKIPSVVSAIDSFISVSSSLDTNSEFSNIIDEAQQIQSDLDSLRIKAHKMRLILKSNRR